MSSRMGMPCKIVFYANVALVIAHSYMVCYSRDLLCVQLSRLSLLAAEFTIDPQFLKGFSSKPEVSLSWITLGIC